MLHVEVDTLSPSLVSLFFFPCLTANQMMAQFILGVGPTTADVELVRWLMEKRLASRNQSQLLYGLKFMYLFFEKLSTLRNDKVVAIACGWSHSMCLTEAGHVYSWGRACDGRLGIGKGNDKSPPADEFEPVLVDWFVKHNIVIKQVF